jgi:valyl-tRNA synthetase
VDLIALVRKAKSNANMPLSAEIEKAMLKMPESKKEILEKVLEDVKNTGKIKELEVKPSDAEGCEITFGR